MSTNPTTEWEKRALAIDINGPVPPDVDRNKLQAAYWELEADGPEKLTADQTNIIDRMPSFQSSGRNEGQDLAANPKPESTQKPVEALQPSIEMGKNENASNGLLEASTGQSLPGTGSTPSLGQDKQEKAPEGYHRNSVGVPIPGEAPTKESLKEEVEKIKDKLKRKKTLLRNLRQRKNVSGETIAEHEAEVARLEEELKQTSAHMLSLPPDVSSDESQPWFGQIYSTSKGVYLIKDEAGGDFVENNETNTGRVLKQMGIRAERDTHTTSPLDRAFTALNKQRHRVDWWGALAGRKPAVINHGGKKIIITKGPDLLEPVKGEFPTIREFIEGLWREQATYAHSWNHLAVSPLYNEKLEPGLALVLAGPVNSGKTAYQNLIITPLLGNRVAKPYSCMIGKTDFNEDWFECEHLKCDDEAPARDYDTQLLFAAELKKLVADPNQWCHGKQKKAITLQPYWRITVSVNDNPEYLKSIPANDETLKDKMAILRAYPEATVKLVERLGGKKVFEEKIREELPAYLDWLLNEFEIPEELKDTRFGMRAHQDPEIVEMIEAGTPYMQLYHYLRRELSGRRIGFREDKFEGLDVASIAKRITDFTTPKGLVPNSLNTLGKYLTNLSRKFPREIVKDHERTRGSVYGLDFSAYPIPPQMAWQDKK
jgi:hypothetical protein